MAVKNIGHAQHLAGLQHGAAVERKALGVVRIVAGRSAVERVALKKRRVIDEVELHPGALSSIQHRAEAILVVKRDGNAGQKHLGVRELGLFIFGKIDGDVVAQLRQGLGQ